MGSMGYKYTLGKNSLTNTWEDIKIEDMKI